LPDQRGVKISGLYRPVMTGIAEISEYWARVNGALIDVVKGLSRAQLDLRAREDWPIWAIVAHSASTRAYWLCQILKQPGAESTPFQDPSGYGWEDDLATPRSAEELVMAHETTWKVVTNWLARWTPTMLDEKFPRDVGGRREWHSHQSIFTRMITHDGYHAGEVSLILLMNGHEGIDPWKQVVAKAP
jgi:uncharacterized damage-inducible protein DinB